MYVFIVVLSVNDRAGRDVRPHKQLALFSVVASNAANYQCFRWQNCQVTFRLPCPKLI